MGTRGTTDRKITMIIGEPCVGKSAIVRKFIQQPVRVSWIQFTQPFAHLLCKQLRTTVLGKYDEGQQFPGTDRLSMSVQPVVQRWFDDPLHHHVLFEGDRLGNLSMAKYLIAHGYDFMLVVVRAHPHVLEGRRAAERHQPDAFVKGRATKVANIVAALPDSLVRVVDNNNPDDIYRAAHWLWQERT